MHHQLCGTIQEQVVCSSNLNEKMRLNDRFNSERVILTAIVLSLGCQLACRIFLLKSNVSNCIASLSPPGRAPFFAPGFPGIGPPIFLALNADLSACSTTSFRVSVSYMRK
jgi:hypothetical protein